MESTIVEQGDAYRQNALNNVLWAIQGFLFLSLYAAGMMKPTMPTDLLTAIMTWPGAMPKCWYGPSVLRRSQVPWGVLLPSLMRMQPWFTPSDAMCLATAMICAVGYHLMLFQGKMLIPRIVLGVIAGYVAWSREVAVPIKTRT